MSYCCIAVRKIDPQGWRDDDKRPGVHASRVIAATLPNKSLKLPPAPDTTLAQPASQAEMRIAPDAEFHTGEEMNC